MAALKRLGQDVATINLAAGCVVDRERFDSRADAMLLRIDPIKIVRPNVTNLSEFQGFIRWSNVVARMQPRTEKERSTCTDLSNSLGCRGQMQRARKKFISDCFSWQILWQRIGEWRV